MTNEATHEYNKDEQSGSGNCVCGHPEIHMKHPHEFSRSFTAVPEGSNTRCRCTFPLSAKIHIWKVS